MELLLIFFGWMLGVFSPIFSKRILIHFQKKNVEKGIRNELDALRIRLSFVSFKMITKFGDLNTDFLKWFKAQVDMSTLTKEFQDELQVSIDDLLKDINKRQSYVAGKKSESRNAVFSSKYFIPFIESQLPFTQYLDIAYTRKLLDIVGYLGYYNDIVEEGRWYFRKTFSSSLRDPDRPIIHDNLDRTYLIIGERAREIAKEITSFLD